MIRLSLIVWSFYLNYILNVILGLITLWIGFKFAKVFKNKTAKILQSKNFDETLTPFFASLVGSLFRVMVVISVASILGIKTTSFVAVLGAMGLTIGMALQGSLSNFAGGFLILIFKPFKNGDTITASGQTGTVQRINLFTTIIKSPCNQVIYLPNGPLASGVIINITQEETRRADMVFGISYDDDIDKAKGILKDILEKNELILNDPAPAVVLTELADSSVNFTVRPWVRTSDFGKAKAEIMEEVKKTFDRENISIPFPQTELHVNQIKKRN